MIAVLRVRFDSNQDLASVWSDDVTTAWMQLLRPWSLGNYWMVAGHGLLPLDSRVLPSVVMTDPRQPQLDVPTNRLRLTQGAADAATADHAVWDDIDILLLVFAQPTDMFGNGSATVTESDGRTKTIPVTVVDIQSTFVDCCQELGHSLGFDHELNAAGGSYASPYSCMSSRTSAAEFLRPAAAGLPVGTTITNPRDSMVGRDPQRVAGALLTGAQLWTTPGFRGSPFVVELTRDYATRPARVRLYPPDWQSNQPPGPRPVLVAVPSNRGDGRMFFVEFRRHGIGYDQGLGNPGGWLAGLAVHSRNPDGRVRYDGVAGLQLAAEQTDWGCVAGDFALRYLAVDAGQDWVDIEIRGGSNRLFPIRGVLLVGGFRSQRELNAMSHDDMRNTLITELSGRTNQHDYQAYDNDTLAGMGATLVFLRNYGLRTDAELRTMTADDIRNTTIVEIDQETGMGRSLQGLTSLELALVALGSDRAVRGVDLTAVPHWIRGVLLIGRFRGQRELNAMSWDDMRNTLIVELTGRTKQRDYQAFNDHRLAGAGAVLVALRHLGARTDSQLRTMSADDMRNTLIVELDAQTHTGAALQGLDDLALACIALGVEPA